MERSDSELMERISAGDEEAFASVVDRLKDPLVNYLSHLVACRDRAEEFAQEAFVRLYRTAERYRHIERIAPHLFRIATNYTISELRREKRWKLLVPRLKASSNGHEPPADGALLSGEIQRQVSAALERLPLKFRAPLVMYEIEEWSYDDIAQALDCRIGTVKSRISRARELMRHHLAPWWLGDTHERNGNRERSEGASARERVAPLHL